MTQPLILTLRMDEDSFARYDALRPQHFPPQRNFIPAHLTLFHALPGESEADIRHRLSALAQRHSPFDLAVTGLRSLGRGVAYKVESTELAVLRDMLAAEWQAWLGPQDRNRHMPHITVQNKVTAENARRLLERLTETFTPHVIRAEGLQLWRYLNGPWESLDIFPFAPTSCIQPRRVSWPKPI